MSPDEIRAHVLRLDNRDVEAASAAWAALRPLQEAVVPYLLEHYRHAPRALARVVLVFHAIRFARTSADAVSLGIAALQDRGTHVRYRACGLLAYSLRRDALPHLRPLLAHADPRTVANAAAAIDAIEHANHHLFIDRNHTGRVRWNVVTRASPTDR
jgi:hypothetical protein